MSREHTLTPPNRGALWLNLALTKTQLADLCGLSTRQIGYWTQRGYLSTSPSHPDHYNGNAVDLCALIKQGLDQGLRFQHALGHARRVLTEEVTGQRGLDSLDAQQLQAIREQLASAVAGMSLVRQSVEPLTAHPDTPRALPAGGAAS
jgi:DNA-binding transcriptional MerR regulator